MMLRRDLGQLPWLLSGWTPERWRMVRAADLSLAPDAEIAGIPAPVPGSVQRALREAGLLPDWNVGLQARACEWVEHRHWIYEVILPDDWLAPDLTHRLWCQGLDGPCEVRLNDQVVGFAESAHRPYRFDLTPHLGSTANRLRLVFGLPPRWLGQFGYTSRIAPTKPRFNYTWDWTPRLVQLGPWEPILLESTDGREILKADVRADLDDRGGVLTVRGAVSDTDLTVEITLSSETSVIRSERVAAARFADGIGWRDLAIEPWWPNLAGDQPLYTVTVTLTDGDRVHDQRQWRVGFRRIEWRPCEGAPADADPWVAVVNGRPIFLQGVNFPPLLPNFADATEARYRNFLATYRALGVNTLRVNGCGIVEREVFYDLCDEMGLLVWQDMPLSSSGIDNVAPTEPAVVAETERILRLAIERRGHHASLLLWCGGNELFRTDEAGHLVPLGLEHPLLGRLGEVVAEEDPSRRFVPTTPTGPRVHADPAERGLGLHWNVHGPWKPPGGLAEWAAEFAADDALFRAETGAPGTSPAAIIRRYAGEWDPLPVSLDNPLWRDPSGWWVEPEAFEAERGRAPETLEEYVAWSQSRQAEALVIVVRACKDRFPRCGGILLWCGHDCYPCPANTSILDFDGAPKPAALALRAIWRGPA